MQELLTDNGPIDYELYLWFSEVHLPDVIHPNNDISATLEQGTDKSKYVGQLSIPKNTVEHDKPHYEHILNAMSNEDGNDLADCDFFLRKCFENGEDVFALSIPIHTIDKDIASKLETGLMMFLWSMLCKTHKLENKKPSSREYTIDYSMNANFLLRLLQHGEIVVLNPKKHKGTIRVGDFIAVSKRTNKNKTIYK